MAELTVERFEDGMESFAKIVKDGFDAVDKQFAEVKTDLGSVKTDLGSVKTDLGSVKTDLGSVKTDLGSVKTDLGSVKTDLGVVKVDLAFVKHDIATQFAATNKRIDDLASGVDGFTKLHLTLEVELVALRDKYNRVAKAHNTLVAIVAPTSDVRV